MYPDNRLRQIELTISQHYKEWVEREPNLLQFSSNKSILEGCAWKIMYNQKYNVCPVANGSNCTSHNAQYIHVRTYLDASVQTLICHHPHICIPIITQTQKGFHGNRQKLRKVDMIPINKVKSHPCSCEECEQTYTALCDLISNNIARTVCL